MIQRFVTFFINYVIPLRKKYGYLPSLDFVSKTFDLKEGGIINNNGVKIVLETYYEKN